ncbi:sialidase family protein [Fuerstiella marisgermanici]|uniref:exo-alpha-sialidase n=1 Tax=Fuerstiella marisgermanici TaxID=1891926 RepID=A0A1P8WSL5_9PLAN|nr:sialidase family protein [Fuerstiella marisgermanici]APZ97033.1 Neuraminidase (sialidase) [Fuerstiella marisgermanici]
MRFSIALLLAYSFATSSITASANDDLAIDLGQVNATADWILLDKTASLDDGTLILDGRQKISRAFYSPLEWSDVKLTAKFFVEPQPKGVLSCGFIVRAVDGSSYYYVHFDRGQAILVRHSEASEWTEIKRASGLKKPAGEWHEGQVECSGNTLRVSLNGNLLYEVQDDNLKGGRIGFYGSQGLVRVKDIRVSGASRKPAEEFHVPLPSYSFVCEDAGAGGYEAFPDICRLSDGRLMCVFYAGYGHIALPNEQLPKGGRISYCLSDDEGQTWSNAATLYDGPDDDRDPSIMQTKSGRLICNFFSLRKGLPGEKYTGLGSWIITSDDMGTTWSEPQQISESQYCSSPIRQLTGGRLILGLYTGAKSDSHGAVVFSDDDGDTWQPEVLINNAGVRLDAETDLIELRDGTLYAAQRPQMAYSTSKDRGATWTVSKPMGFPGHCPYFLRTNDDVIVLAFRIPNTSLRFSRDECQSWSDNIVVDGVIGAYPSMVNLKDGSVLIVYYEEGSGSSIRSKRFRITDSGLEWIPPSQ